MTSKVNNGKAEWLPLAGVTAVVASSAVGVLAWYIWTNQQQQQQQRQIRIQVPRNVQTSPWIKELMLAVKLATKGERQNQMFVALFLCLLYL
jgi:nicotinamide riboside transporter PnuC